MQTQPCKGTVVVVDDEQDTRELICELVEARGYRVVSAEDGVAALEVLATVEQVCFVVLDLVMPRMDGFGVLRALAADPRLRGVNVCVSTSAPDRAPPGVPCLAKPIDVDRLLSIIDERCSSEAQNCSA